jgi:hypothetical protein
MCGRNSNLKKVSTRAFRRASATPRASVWRSSDPVLLFQSFSREWNSIHFVRNNSQTREGRKLCLAERFKRTPPDSRHKLTKSFFA